MFPNLIEDVACNEGIKRKENSREFYRIQNVLSRMVLSTFNIMLLLARDYLMSF